MTVTVTKRLKRHTGNSAATVFPYDFYIPTSDDVQVSIYEIATETETVLTSGQYSISGLGDPAFGSVTYPLAGSPLASTHYIIIKRIVAPIQTTSITNQSAFLSSVIETALDRVTMVLQQTTEELNRVPKLLSGEAFTKDLPERSALVNKAVVGDANGDLIAGPTITDIETAQTYAAAATTSATAAAASATAASNSATAAAASAAAAEAATARPGIFRDTAEIEAATIDDAIDYLTMPEAGAVLDKVVGTPSPVEPWHVQADSGQYFEMRFPDGRVSLRAWAGDDQGVDFGTDDTTLFQYAADYINRAWWETSGGEAQGDFQRGVIYVPPGAWTIDPTDPVIAYDYMKLIGAGTGQSLIRAQNTSAGSLIQRPATATYNSSQRTTHCLIEGIRFIPTGVNQIMLDMRHCGRLTVRGNMCTRQDRPDEWNNALQTALSGTRFLQLNNSDSVLVGGDVALVEGNYCYWIDVAVRSGDASGTTPGPEKLRVVGNEFSDCLNPVIVNDYGGAGGLYADNTIQRWAVGSRAIDIVARYGTIRGNYLESTDNDRPPILLRSGSLNMVVHRYDHVNYTAQNGVVGPPAYQTLGSNDGTDCIDEHGNALASTFYGWPVAA